MLSLAEEKGRVIVVSGCEESVRQDHELKAGG